MQARTGQTPARSVSASATPDPLFGALVPIVAVAAGTIVLWTLLHTPPVMCVNDASRWDTVWSLVHRGTYVIGTDAEPEPWDTIDKVKRDGCYYSSKPPLYPTVLAGEYWLIWKVTGLTIRDNTDAVCRILLFTWNVVPLVGFVWLYGRYLGRHARDPWARGYWLIAGALGTYITGYSVTLNNHTPAAWGVMYALYFLIRILYEGDQRPVNYLLVGLCSMWVAANETAGIVFPIAVFVIFAFRRDQLAWTYAFPPALLLLVAYAATTYVSTGGLIPYYFLKDTPLYLYPGSHWLDPQGIDGQHEPKWLYVAHSTLGHHGLFSLSPVFLLALVSTWQFLTKKDTRLAEIRWLTLVLSVLIYAAYVAKTGNYGGGAKGFRWMFWLMPTWLVVAPLGAERYSRSRAFQLLALVLLFVSVWTAFDALSSPWGSSWLHNIMRDKWHWVDY